MCIARLFRKPKLESNVVLIDSQVESKHVTSCNALSEKLIFTSNKVVSGREYLFGDTNLNCITWIDEEKPSAIDSSQRAHYLYLEIRSDCDLFSKLCIEVTDDVSVNLMRQYYEKKIDDVSKYYMQDTLDIMIGDMTLDEYLEMQARDKLDGVLKPVPDLKKSFLRDYFKHRVTTVIMSNECRAGYIKTNSERCKSLRP